MSIRDKSRLGVGRPCRLSALATIILGFFFRLGLTNAVGVVMTEGVSNVALLLVLGRPFLPFLLPCTVTPDRLLCRGMTCG